MTTEEFIEKAKAVHGNKYDYSESVVVNRKTNTRILCKQCGQFFEMTPDNHLRGQECPNNVCRSARRKASFQAKYGCDNAMQCDVFKKKQQDTLEEHYGVRNPMKTEQIRSKQSALARETMKELYGVEYPGQSKEIRARMRATTEKRYGVPNVMQSSEFQKKMLDRKRENGTQSSSQGQDRLYEMLCDVFGKDNVYSEHDSDEYPFHCDFYVVHEGKEFYIELNGYFTHGTHWFDSNNSEDVAHLEQLKERDTEISRKEIYVWSDLDVRKRETARKNNLNYVVFWDSDLRDAELWFAMGCPYGQDWDRMYSWIPERDFSQTDINIELKPSSQTLSLIAKMYQLNVFYENEIKLWQENKQRNDVPLQVWLYYNRMVHAKKLPNNISNLALLRGFTQSGLYHGHSVFDTSLMNEFVQKYDIESMYDPCAGWGERMLYCKTHDVKYLGVDINEKLRDGYVRMMHDYDITEQVIEFADSANVKLNGQFDCVLTCPPYGNQEIYSEQGAENLSTEEFLKWWDAVVKNSLNVDPKYFCVQLNQKWLEKLVPIVESNGFKQIDRFDGDVKASHMNKGRKKEFESMVVFERV